MINFNHSVLYISARSPFARRVRLAFLENNIQFSEKIFDVFKPHPDLIAVNPLARVPTLELKSGQVLIDSNLILQSFYENIDSPLKGSSAADRLEIYRWSALGAGLCEKVVEYFLESLRPVEKRDPELIEEITEIIARVLTLSEDRLQKDNPNWLVGTYLTQADLDMATAMTYLSLRVSTDWMKKFPCSAIYLARLEERASFQKTRPLV